MTAYSLLAARASIGAAAVALAALATLHGVRPDIRPASTMISQYALGRHGWLMALCFAMFGVASACLVIAFGPHVRSPAGLAGPALLLLAAAGFSLAAYFPMDPVSTPPARMSLSGKLHGLSFLLCAPCLLLAVLILPFTPGEPSWRTAPLLGLASIIWLSMATVIAIMLMVGPGKPPDPTGPERFLGWPNRLFMVAYGAWVCGAAWPMAR